MTNYMTAAAPPAALDLENAIAEDRVRWAAERFGERLVMTTSFGIQSAVMLHLVTRIVPETPSYSSIPVTCFPRPIVLQTQARMRAARKFGPP